MELQHFQGVKTLRFDFLYTFSSSYLLSKCRIEIILMICVFSVNQHNVQKSCTTSKISGLHLSVKNCVTFNFEHSVCVYIYLTRRVNTRKTLLVPTVVVSLSSLRAARHNGSRSEQARVVWPRSVKWRPLKAEKTHGRDTAHVRFLFFKTVSKHANARTPSLWVRECYTRTRFCDRVPRVDTMRNAALFVHAVSADPTHNYYRARRYAGDQSIVIVLGGVEYWPKSLYLRTRHSRRTYTVGTESKSLL